MFESFLSVAEDKLLTSLLVDTVGFTFVALVLNQVYQGLPQHIDYSDADYDVPALIIPSGDRSQNNMEHKDADIKCNQRVPEKV